jgi:hypothetical protein
MTAITVLATRNTGHGGACQEFTAEVIFCLHVPNKIWISGQPGEWVKKKPEYTHYKINYSIAE